MTDTTQSQSAALIRYRDPKGAIDWLGQAFDFKPRFISTRADGSFAYAHLAFEGQQITVTARDQRSLGPADPADEAAEHTLTATDIKAHLARAKAAGADIVRGIEAGKDGVRGFVCRDVEGHVWSFRSVKTERFAGLRAWGGMRVPHIEKLAAQRAGLAAAALLTLVALAVPMWRFQSQVQTLAAPAPPPPAHAEGQMLEHARFALAEEQVARHVAEASRSAALAELGKEREARLEAEREARRFEAELSAALATRAAEHGDPDEQAVWEAEVAPAFPSADARAQGEIVPVSAVEPPAETARSPHPLLQSGNPQLAEGEAALAKGDIDGARRLFRRLAEEGVAAAALALGSTYDPVNAKQMAPAEMDAAQAKQWYRRAIELAQTASEKTASEKAASEKTASERTEGERQPAP
jgi:uncharacterized glyoxalase superfamily protein PhnB